MTKTAFITGITGQDGAYLAELLLEKNYRVVGLQRRCSSSNTARIQHIIDEIELVYGDMGDASGLIRFISKIKPNEIYNLAAQSHVGVSFDAPEYTGNVDGLGTVRLLEAIRISGQENNTRFFQASTSELYGKTSIIPQDESTPFAPRSPYAVAKLYAYWITVNYREAYGMYACNGIMFNHESPLRGEDFVTHKITKAAAEIALGLKSSLTLGNLDACRDWGHAKDYMNGVWKMLQQEVADDYVLATGATRTVRDCVTLAFAYTGIKLKWVGAGVEEKGVDKNTGKILVSVDPKHFRPTEVDVLCGNAAKAAAQLNWKQQISFDEMIKEMVQSDLNNYGVTKKSVAA